MEKISLYERRRELIAVLDDEQAMLMKSVIVDCRRELCMSRKQFALTIDRLIMTEVKRARRALPNR